MVLFHGNQGYTMALEEKVNVLSEGKESPGSPFSAQGLTRMANTGSFTLTMRIFPLEDELSLRRYVVIRLNSVTGVWGSFFGHRTVNAYYANATYCEMLRIIPN
ncbi:hypothetical protein L1987_31955 [Smallanthus sonchifolius]|uniref:Uncharacterized protein n=1 Tax=Smallanthus sonchifolius TaxID=185202 RepID=A0ACB9I886_9ASTR|nr:hypothetical protein L1987_31955 [Smallanthus sonchifolius]